MPLIAGDAGDGGLIHAGYMLIHLKSKGDRIQVLERYTC